MKPAVQAATAGSSALCSGEEASASYNPRQQSTDDRRGPTYQLGVVWIEALDS